MQISIEPVAEARETGETEPSQEAPHKVQPQEAAAAPRPWV